MMLPDRDRAHVDRAKIIDYLLSSSHPDALRADALRNTAISVVESAHGTRYTVDGPLPAPEGRAPMVRTVWIVEAGSAPRLIRADPP